MMGGRAQIKLAIASLTIWALTSPVHADEIVMPRHRVERNKALDIRYRMEKPGTGNGTLTIEWTDVTGRLVERFEQPFSLANKSEILFSLDLRRAVAVINKLRAHLSFHSIDGTGDRERDVQLAFAVPPAKAWRDYQAIMWQGKTSRQYAALKQLGITAGAAFGQLDTDPTIAALCNNNLRWYVENIATDFYSAYHRWFPDRPVNWRFELAKQQYREDPASASALIRDPSLSDAHWLLAVRERLRETVRVHTDAGPLYYNLGDEPGIADLSIAWDFDVSESSLTAMRRLLKGQYGTLSALNRQWGTSFRRWTSVVPLTTREAMARRDENFSAWADFKAWMDVAFARALRAGTDAVHAADAEALSGIEGGQVPGWGGYDYSRLAHAVDLIELYDGGGNLEILRSLNPEMVLLTTSAGGAREVHTIWRELLRGTRGVILWDPDNEFVHEDGTRGPRANALSADLRQMRDGLGALLINAVRQFDPIAILYSPASIRTRWLLDWKSKGDAWATRAIDESYEDPSPVRAAMMGFAQAFESLGFHPRFVSPELLAQGELLHAKYRLLILPRALALSGPEVDQIMRFLEQGGIVLADGEPGIFDEHSRMRNKPPLSHLIDRSSDTSAITTRQPRRNTIHVTELSDSCSENAAAGPCQAVHQLLARMAERAGLRPVVRVNGPDDQPISDVETYVFQEGGTTIVGLQRDAGGSAGNRGDMQASESVVVTLPEPSFVYDLRARRNLGNTRKIDLVLDANRPTLLSITSAPSPPLIVKSLDRTSLGKTVEIRVSRLGESLYPDRVFHVDVIDPRGRLVPEYGGNLLAANGTAELQIPIALNDPTGIWKIEFRDAGDGQTAKLALEVSEN